MKRSLLGGLFVVLATPGIAAAFNFPAPSEICEGGVVSKAKLAKAMIIQSPDAKNLFINADDGATRPAEFKPQWRRIFLDKQFCVGDPGCEGPSITEKPVNGKPVIDDTAAKKTLRNLREGFADAMETSVNGRYYSMPNSTIGLKYLSASDNTVIKCVGPDYPVAEKPYKIALPVRLRANSDDLGIDRNDQRPEVKSVFPRVKPATITYTQDGVARTNVARMQAAIGYPIQIPRPDSFRYFDGEIVPFISATQTITKAAGKPSVYSDSNTVAAGALLNIEGILKGVASGVDNTLSAKPQYIWNTKDKSEIANLNFIYTPYIQGQLRLNTDIRIGHLGNAGWLTPLFDVRDYIGEYTNVGIDPVQALANQSYHRGGTRFGFSYASPQSYGHFVLNVTETLLYGFSGSLRQLDLFETDLSFYFDSTSNFAFTLAYSKGRNVDTAERVQMWTTGLSAKF
ncbi:hypothetical protein [Tardiphaga robiniae]|uniref:Uncharacterized protein n=1 Tax=Tardiphaga robiniae TaxID=943830 RepID=A0A164B444_9BRAD|nr:hypothetical protein [Tardiphaga robiniae]KZD25730.1 hypothetical protein A4A58_04920 [Tardiphaga robiniae]